MNAPPKALKPHISQPSLLPSQPSSIASSAIWHLKSPLLSLGLRRNAEAGSPEAGTDLPCFTTLDSELIVPEG